ncbi:hypothetical protein MITSMUL_03567 [Mitsuokella multacida DSM 20544]|uniref:Uncharacterized protein n=1 Tax=Mitsuokella multacida DSM 20544 TaxID=500635 RepID=C9KK68_9FIRM|nr:hypothetical protein MITSMUL_03567 [Mitsuokella multacida DSM 20544]
MHRIRLLGLLIFLYYTTSVVIRKVQELDEPAAAAEMVQKAKKEAADNWGGQPLGQLRK